MTMNIPDSYIRAFSEGLEYIKAHYGDTPTKIIVVDQLIDNDPSSLQPSVQYRGIDPNNGTVFLNQHSIQAALDQSPEATNTTVAHGATTDQIAFIQGVEAGAEYIALFHHPEISQRLQQYRESFNNRNPNDAQFFDMFPISKVQSEITSNAMQAIGIQQEKENYWQKKLEQDTEKLREISKISR